MGLDQRGRDEGPVEIDHLARLAGRCRNPTRRDTNVLETARARQAGATEQQVETHPSNTSMASDVGFRSLIGKMSWAHAVRTT